MAKHNSLQLKGSTIFKGYLSPETQNILLSDIRKIAKKAPLFAPLTPWGKPMSVKMTSAGRFGWYSDRKGYRYIPKHPSGTDWPEIPRSVMEIWLELCPNSPNPECCLVNYYGKSAKMGLHKDNDEKSFAHPVMSISLGDDALFRIGGCNKADPTTSVWLNSGDVVIMDGQSRLAYHGIDRVKFNSSQLLRDGGRINLTLRVVN